jgi:hypothetical protein
MHCRLLIPLVRLAPTTDVLVALDQARSRERSTENQLQIRLRRAHRAVGIREDELPWP